MRVTRICVLAVIGLAAGCGLQANVKPFNEDYSVIVNDREGDYTIQQVDRAAVDAVDSHCANMGKKVRVINKVISAPKARVMAGVTIPAKMLPKGVSIIFNCD